MKKPSSSHFTDEETEVQFGHVRFNYEDTDVSIHCEDSPGWYKHSLSYLELLCLQVPIIICLPDSH